MFFWRRKSALWLQGSGGREPGEWRGGGEVFECSLDARRNSSKSDFPNILTITVNKKETITSVTPLIPAGILKDLQHVEIFHGGLPVTPASSVLQQTPQAGR